jgi:hypothetical protein
LRYLPQFSRRNPINKIFQNRVIYVYWKDLYPQHTVQFAAAGVFLLFFLDLAVVTVKNEKDSRYFNFPCLSCCCERFNSPLAVASANIDVLFKKRSMFLQFGITLFTFLNNH